MYIICIGNRETTKWLPSIEKITIRLGKAEWLFCYLLKIITNAIIKAMAMIVTATNPKNSRLIIFNSIISIAPPRFLTAILCSM